MDIRIGYPDQLERNSRADLVSDPAYATALGLVWAGFKQVDERISFFSDPGRVVVEEPPRVVTQTPKPAQTPKQKEPPKRGFLGAIRDFLTGDNYNPDSDRYE